MDTKEIFTKANDKAFIVCSFLLLMMVKTLQRVWFLTIIWALPLKINACHLSALKNKPGPCVQFCHCASISTEVKPTCETVLCKKQHKEKPEKLLGNRITFPFRISVVILFLTKQNNHRGISEYFINTQPLHGAAALIIHRRIVQPSCHLVYSWN